MNFVLLDLDTSFFTKPQDLEAIYGPLWGILPIHLGLVPFHRGRGQYVPPGADPERCHTLMENGKLVDYLREKCGRGEARILLHGYDHEKLEGGGEFSRPIRTAEKIRQGRAALEEAFGIRIHVFLPPNGKLCREAMIELRKQGMHLVGRFSFDPRRRERDYPPETLWNWARRQFFLRRHPDLPFPWVIRSGGLGELDCLWLMPGDTLSKLASVADGIRRTGGTFCLATHYWELMRFCSLKDSLVGFIRELSSAGGTRFPSIEEVFSVSGRQANASDWRSDSSTCMAARSQL